MNIYKGFELGNVISKRFQQMINADQHSYPFIVRNIVARPWDPSSELTWSAEPLINPWLTPYKPLVNLLLTPY